MERCEPAKKLHFARVTYSVTCVTFNVALSHPGPENSLVSKIPYLQKIPCPRQLEIDAHDPANACLKGKVYMGNNVHYIFLTRRKRSREGRSLILEVIYHIRSQIILPL